MHRVRGVGGGDATRRRTRRRRPGRVSLAVGVTCVLVVVGLALGDIGLLGGSAHMARDVSARRPRWQQGALPAQSLDGTGNNHRHPDRGAAGTNYARVAPARYADGLGEPVAGPDGRYLSNRIFNDSHQNLFSERGVTQWVFAWGQFIDHTIGRRDETGDEANIPFGADDPLEEFTNTVGHIPFTRSAASTGTGVDRPRQQVNTISSYIDAWAVYGGSDERLEWLRQGPVDGDMSNNSAYLLLPEGNLPRRDERGDPAGAPEMAVDGMLRAQPHRAAVAGDVRANENIALQATQTLFAREHNRIVSLLPDRLGEEEKFQIARRVVIAEQQYITYNEFLPAVGVRLGRYRGYRPGVDASLTNEFATVGYRAHSMIHGELELEAAADRYSPEEIAEYEAMGIEIEASPDRTELEMAVPLNVAFFNPDLVESLGLGPVLQGIGLEAQYSNDEMIDNQLRSVLFQIPSPDNPRCLDGPELPACYQGVVDLGALDVERGRDHGMPSYNELREAYGLPPKASFQEITGESTESFPDDPVLTPGAEVDDPDSLEIVRLWGRDGAEIPLESDEAESSAVRAERRTTLAARLAAVYGSVDELDAFTGMVAEAHVRGTEFGELQRAIWTEQFRALRDGDRFFYGNDPGLSAIRRTYGIDFRVTLAEVIAANSDVPLDDLSPNVFVVADE